MTVPLKALAADGDVEALYRSLTLAEEGTVEALLRVASALVRSAVPSVDERLAAGTLDPLTVADVVATMVGRVYRNPGGLHSETIGPYAYAVDERAAAGFLYLQPQELALLAPRAAAVDGLGMIQLAPAL